MWVTEVYASGCSPSAVWHMKNFPLLHSHHFFPSFPQSCWHMWQQEQLLQWLVLPQRFELPGVTCLSMISQQVPRGSSPQLLLLHQDVPLTPAFQKVTFSKVGRTLVRSCTYTSTAHTGSWHGRASSCPHHILESGDPRNQDATFQQFSLFHLLWGLNTLTEGFSSIQLP